MKRGRLGLIGSLVWVLVMSGCALRLTPIGVGAGPFTPDSDEVVLWREAEREAAELLRRVRVYDDADLVKYLNGLLERLTPDRVREAGGLLIRVEVLRDPALNAFALPDARVFVHSGLLAALESEAQLALVLAREVAHVVHRHTLSVARAERLPPPAYEGVGRLSPAATAIHGRRLRLSAAAAVTGYGTRLERDADDAGSAMLARAGWNLEEAATVWPLLSGRAAGSLETFLLGRPAWLRERSEFTRRLLATETRPAAVAARSAAEFELRMRPVVRDNAAEDIRHGRFALAARALDRVVAATPADPLAHLHYGDLHRLQAQRAGSAEARARGAERARACYERAIELEPWLAQAYRQLGLLHYEQQDLAQARTALQSYLTLAPGAPDAARIAEYVQELAR
jgi:predicted Zn-dependent protease